MSKGQAQSGSNLFSLRREFQRHLENGPMDTDEHFPGPMHRILSPLKHPPEAVPGCVQCFQLGVNLYRPDADSANCVQFGTLVTTKYKVLQHPQQL